MSERSGTLATEDDVVLSQAITPWVERGESREIVRWLDRELDRQLVPVRLPIDAWWPTLDRLEEARRRRPEGWPVVVDVSLEGFLRAALWFTGHDGNTLPDIREDRPVEPSASPLDGRTDVRLDARADRHPTVPGTVAGTGLGRTTATSVPRSRIAGVGGPEKRLGTPARPDRHRSRRSVPIRAGTS